MKKIIVVVVVLAFAALGVAEFNAVKHQVFVERLSNLMHQFQDSREECKRLVTQWFTENIASSPDFVDHASGLTVVEMTAVIDYCQAVEAFNENAAVVPSDRRQIITPFIGTRVRR